MKNKDVENFRNTTSKVSSSIKEYYDNKENYNEDFAEYIKDDDAGSSTTRDGTSKGNYHYCINCHRTYTEFLPDSYDWQYVQRCILCERKYQQDFMEKHPDTKRRHKLDFLTEEEEIFYAKMMKEERDFSGDNNE